MTKTILISLALIFIFNISPVLAEGKCNPEIDICYTPEVTIPGFSTSAIKADSKLLGNYISSLYEYLLYVAGVLAVIVIMVGGFQWVIAGGNQSKIGEAKERIISAIIGLFLALGSYLLLFTINPKLIEIHDLNMPDISPISNYCEGDTEVKFFKHLDEKKGGIFYFRKEDINNNGKIEGKEASCGNIYKYGVSFQCRGTNCHDTKKLCALDGKCYDPAEALCKGREKGASCGGSDDLIILNASNNWVGNYPYGYCKKDDGKCIACAKVGDICGAGSIYYYIPQYRCPNSQGKCGKGAGDYCNNWTIKCSKKVNGGGNGF